MKRIYQLLLVSIIFSCSTPTDQAQKVIDEAIDAHGCSIFQDHTISFTFREKDYSVDFQSGKYIYTRSFIENGQFVMDSLINSSSFSRYIDEERAELTEEWVGKYSRSVNSVLYFFRIPCVLNDPAVIKTYQGSTTIESNSYDVIEVRFQSEGGGDDFEDTFMYWINQNTHQVDYLAYNYQTDEGGTRFRKAINKRTVSGLLVQDYINYAPAEKFPPLVTLPDLFAKGELKELSKIVNENIKID